MPQQHTPRLPDAPFVNDVRLGARHWLIASALVLLVALATPRVWTRIERFETGPDFRIPYALSKDYWLYERRLGELADPKQIIVLGDSVIWGEYVLPDGTLSHFLNQAAGERDRFVNGGVNGLFPLALEGLAEHYGSALHGRKLIVHGNVLWMSSPKADLRVAQEEQFNHSRLVPQFRPRIPCYKADANERLAALVERNVSFLAWVRHLQNTAFEQRNILSWTLADDGADPPRFPNSYQNPLAQITLTVPAAPRDDPARGPGSARHKPWFDSGARATDFEWVELETSLQWGALQRTLRILRARGNDVLVVLGPFNEHLMTEENKPAFRRLRDGIAAWLAANRFPHVVPATLPSALYADASHPLTEGYQLLAGQLSANETFRTWVKQ